MDIYKKELITLPTHPSGWVRDSTTYLGRNDGMYLGTTYLHPFVCGYFKKVFISLPTHPSVGAQNYYLSTYYIFKNWWYASITSLEVTTQLLFGGYFKQG